MKHLLGNADIARYFVVTLALALAACGGKKNTDALDAARIAVEASADAEPCADAEYAAARNLLEQAEAAYAARDYARARNLAAAAEEQAEYARQVAIANAEDCNRVSDITEEVEQIRDTRDQGEPVDTDYEFGAVYFDFDASGLTTESRARLDAHAAQLRANPDWRIRVEGHCDEKGTTQYNLALGDRRARSVRDYLIRLGVDGGRIATVSYGAELPVSSQDRMNRRAEFEVRR